MHVTVLGARILLWEEVLELGLSFNVQGNPSITDTIENQFLSLIVAGNATQRLVLRVTTLTMSSCQLQQLWWIILLKRSKGVMGRLLFMGCLSIEVNERIELFVMRDANVSLCSMWHFDILCSCCVLACYTTLWEDWWFLLPTSKHAERVILPCCLPKDGSHHCATEYANLNFLEQHISDSTRKIGWSEKLPVVRLKDFSSTILV